MIHVTIKELAIAVPALLEADISREMAESIGAVVRGDAIVLHRVREAELASRFGHGDRYPLDGEVEVDGVIYGEYVAVVS